MLNLNDLLAPEYREQGFKLEEQENHDIVLLLNGREMARFSKTKITAAAMVKIIAQDVSKN
jgi:hypothetical protein